MKKHIVGWDIGGAHLKAVLITPPSHIFAVYQQPCPLWQGLDKLIEAAQAILEQITQPVDCHSLTMTGELVDLFSDRDHGVHLILKTMHELLGHRPVWVYAGKNGIIELSKVKNSHYASIASANWLASASWAAQSLSNGLLIDIGSTTTDILLLQGGLVISEGYSDYERLISKELIYTGIIRTAVMAVVQSIQDNGYEVGLMAEYFASMADVYRVTGELNEQHDQYISADGAEKTPAASAKRLARMIGCDYQTEDTERWLQFALNIRQHQLMRIQQACELRLAKGCIPAEAPIIGAGIGRFLAIEIAQRLNRPYRDFTTLFIEQHKDNYTVADCAPAAAAACLVEPTSPVSNLF